MQSKQALRLSGEEGAAVSNKRNQRQGQAPHIALKLFAQEDIGKHGLLGISCRISIVKDSCKDPRIGRRDGSDLQEAGFPVSEDRSDTDSQVQEQSEKTYKTET